MHPPICGGVFTNHQSANRIEILKSVRITHAGSCSYIILAPYVPLMHPYMPLTHPLHAPYAPLTCPLRALMHPLHAPYVPLGGY